MRRDDGGFTLIELLVAMVILAIIVTPLLRSFAVSANTNAKARKNMTATAVAEDLAEGIKGAAVEKLAYEFNYPSVSFNVINRDIVGGTPCELLFDGTDYHAAVLNTDASILSPDGGVTWEFTGQPSGIYYFYVPDISMKVQKFDALIRLDASPYRTGGTADNLYNSMDVAAISKIKNSHNGVFIQGLLQDNEVMADLNAMGTFPVTEDNLYRDISIEIEQNTIGTSTVTSAKVIYDYSGKKVGEADVSKKKESLIFDNQAGGETLENLYLFYTPLYASKSGSIKDVITIKNPQDVPVNVYLIKQENTSSGTLQTKEALYKMQLNVTEDSVKAEAATKIRTNLDYNLAAAYITGLPAAVNQTEYSYNGTTNQTLIRNQLDVRNLAASESWDRIYDIKVTVYEQGSLSGGTFDFSEDRKIYEIMGSTQE